jgi:hypothetical protein
LQSGFNWLAVQFGGTSIFINSSWKFQRDF